MIKNKRVWIKVKNRSALRYAYLRLLPTIKQVANKAGYAVAVHGSCARDFDIMAMPWEKWALAPELLASAIEIAVCKYPPKESFHKECKNKCIRCITVKPHGRLAFTILLGPGVKGDKWSAFIDLSVMPRKNKRTP